MLFRSFIYGGFFAFVANMYPKKHFGKLVGFANALFGLIQLIQGPLLNLVLGPFDSNFLPLNIIFCLSSLIAMFFPLYYYVKIKRTENTISSITILTEKPLV